MKRLAGWALPIVLGVTGVVLIMVGTLGPQGEPTSSLPPIGQPSPTATPSPAASAGSVEPSASPEGSPTASPTPSPLPDDVVAEQLEIRSVGINVLVRQSTSEAIDAFPPDDAAYILRNSVQPGRNQSSYIFAHALNHLFKPLWNVQLGDEVRVLMSDGSVLRYVVTEVRPNIPCPDPGADPALNPLNPPPALQIHDDCDEGRWWLATQPYERLTLQTSQGYNRNWGELIVVARRTG